MSVVRDIRKDIFRKRQQPWNPKWDAYFAPRAAITDRNELVQGYWRMREAFARDLGVGGEGLRQ